MICLQSGMCQPQRATQDVGINQHAFIRVHVHPKRFPAVYTVDWKVSMLQHSASCPKGCYGLSVFCVKIPVKAPLLLKASDAETCWNTWGADWLQDISAASYAQQDKSI